MNIMAEENVMAELINLLEVEPAAALPAPGSEIPALHEQLAILVSSGRCKESIGVNLTHEQVKRLEDKDVMKYSKRLEAYVGAKTNEALIDNFLAFYTKALGRVVKLNDPEALKNELKNDYIIANELSTTSGSLSLRCGRFLTFTNSVLITAKHIDFSSEEHPSDGNPLAGQDNAKQSSANVK